MNSKPSGFPLQSKSNETQSFLKQIILGKAKMQTHQLLSYNTLGKKVIRNPVVSLSHLFPDNNQKLIVVSPGNNQKPSGFSGQ